MNLRPLAGRASVAALVVTLFGAAATRSTAQDAPVQHPAVLAAQRIRTEVAKMRGLEYQAEVKVGVKTPAQLKAMVLEDFETEAPAEEVSKQEKVFKLLGLLPQDYDLRARLIEFLSEQIGGYYDPEKKELFLIDQSADGGAQVPGAQAAMDEMVMAHELHHALQDQNFDLTRWFELLSSHDDRIQGYKSLVEGEAQLVGMQYLFGKMGRGDVDIAGFNRMQEMALRMSPEGAKMRAIPPFLLENLMFPYTQGAEFVQKMQRERGWARIGQAFNDPPSSTEQVLHPEKFYGDQRDEPMELMLPAFESAFGDDAGEVKELYENTLGEFNVVLLLRALGANKAVAAKAAAGWDGDRFKGFETQDGRVVLVWLTTWDSEAEAQEFEAAYKKALGATALRHLERRGSEVLLVGGANEQERPALVRKAFAAIKYEPRFVPLPGLTAPPSREDFTAPGAAAAEPAAPTGPTGPNGSRLYHFDSIGATLRAPEGFSVTDDPVGQLHQMGSVHLEGPEGARARLLLLPIPMQNADEQLQALITQGVPDAEVRSKERTRAFGREALWIDFVGTLPRETARSWCRVLVLDLGPDSLAIGASAPDGQGDPQKVIESLMQTLWVDGAARPGAAVTTIDAASFEAPEGFVAARARAGQAVVCSLEHPSGAKVQVVRGAMQTSLADSTRALEAQLPLVLDDFQVRASGVVTRRDVPVHEMDFTAAGRRTRQLTLDAAGERWTVTCSAPADRFGEHLAAFGRVLASFKVVDAGQATPAPAKPEQQKSDRRAY